MSRWWNDVVAALADVTPGGVIGVAIGLLILAAVVAILWYTWPPRLFFGRGSAGGRDGGGRRRRSRSGWPRWRWRLRWRRRRKRRKAAADLDELAPDELPDVPARVLALTADQLAAQGRYAEAVRERLRAIVRELVEREIVDHRPGWTVTELAAAAGHARPLAAPGLQGASGTFSEIWYGQRPATVEDDVRMRDHAQDIHQALAVAA